MGATLHRSARTAIRATKAQRRRLYGLLRSAGDVRALVLDCNRQLREWKLPPVVTYQGLCRVRPISRKASWQDSAMSLL